MKRFSLLFSDGKDFVFIPNKKLFGNKKDAVIYIKKSKNRYVTESRSISLYDLKQEKFEIIEIKDVSKVILNLIEEELNI